MSAAKTAEQPVRRVPLSEPLFGGNEWAYLKACLDSGWVSSAGPFVARFEEEIARTLGVAHAVATASGTAALHVALQVAGVEPGDEVLAPALTFIAPINAIRYCGAQPVFVDAHPATWQLDARQAAAFLAESCERRGNGTYNARTGRRVRAILPVHLLGLACDMDPLLALADQHHLRIVEDAAEALGARYRGQAAGTFGVAGVLSFNGNKVVTAGGGGMLLTADAELARKARYLTTQAKDDPIESIHEHVGYNYRLTNLQAALGLAQLEQLEALLAKKRAIAHAYAQRLGASRAGLTLMPQPPQVESTSWLYTVLLPAGTTLAQRQAAVAHLRAEGFEARPLWHPIPSLPPYRASEAISSRVATDLYHRAISLPSSPSLLADDIDRCADCVLEWVAAHG